MERTYIIGHKSPDLDSVAAAVTYADYKNKLGRTDKFLPAAAGELNELTKFVLEKWGFPAPQIISDASGKRLILVDHNEASQSVDGIDKAVIAGILDHHKVNFSYKDPIRVSVWPLGSSNSIIYKKYKAAKLEVDKKLAGLMLSAILDDTVITKSPTCTPEDKKLIKQLSAIAEVSDWQAYGVEMFKRKASVAGMSALEIVKSDFKDFSMKQGKIGIGQAETVDLAAFQSREKELLKELEGLCRSGGYHTCLLFITDIIKEGSLFLVATSDRAKTEQALGAVLEDNKVYLEGIISRKKQVAPKFMEVFDK